MSIIKPRRGTGSPAGSIETNEIAMDTTAKTLYVSTDGTNAVILSDNTENFLANAASTDNFLISGVAGGINYGTGAFGLSALTVKTDPGGWDKMQIALEDGFEKVSAVGASVGANQWRSSLTMDPNNVKGRTGVTTYAGDYSIVTEKDFSDTAKTSIRQNVFGANDGFVLTIYDDNNSSSPNPGPFSPAYGGYGYKPFIVQGENFLLKAKDSDTSVAQVLKVDNTEALFDTKLYMNNKQLTTNADGFSKTPVFRRTTTNSTTNPRAGMSVQSDYKDSFNFGNYVAPTAGAGAATGWLVNAGFLGAVICDLSTVAVNADNTLDASGSSANMKFNLYTDGANQQTGNTLLTLNNSSVKAGKPFENVSLSADPSSPVNGWQYYNSTTHKLRLYANGAWVDLN